MSLVDVKGGETPEGKEELALISMPAPDEALF
jgi:hypothetical protein